jgi:hypothetical protein
MSSEATTRDVSGRQMEKLVGKFDRLWKRSGDVIVDRFGEETAAVMRGDILDEYRRLLPEVPYIGGWRDSHSGHLMFTARALALHRVVIRHGGSVEDTGWLLHRMMENEMERIPRVVRHGMGRFRFTRLGKWWEEAGARKSQARRYPGDWVFERIDGDGETFDFGRDTTECGNVKYLHAQEADELTPYLCDLDYVNIKAMGYGLQRTKTLAWGCDRCDFRYSKHGVTSAPWPPEFVERNCGQPHTEEETAGS